VKHGEKNLKHESEILRVLATLLLVAVLATTSAAQTLTGRCIRVADGDTITVLTPAKWWTGIRTDGRWDGFM